MNKSTIINQFTTEFSRTTYENPFKAKLLPYAALAASLNLKLWHDSNGFEFRTVREPMMGRLIAKVQA
jgi:hypothetical protein